MISNEKVVTYKVVDHSEIFNFVFDHFFIWGYLYKSKKLNFKIEELQTKFWDYKQFQIKKSSVTKSWDLQLWYKVCFHPTLFEKVMNFIVLQHNSSPPVRITNL